MLMIKNVLTESLNNYLKDKNHEKIALPVIEV